MFIRSLLLVIGCLLSLQSGMAQCKLRLKNNFMYSPMSLIHNKKTILVDEMIDTGCTLCVLDSTYAVEVCGFSLNEGRDLSIQSASKEIVSSKRVVLDSIEMGGKVYIDVDCCVLNLKDKLRDFAPQMIVGANVLKQDLWCFDLPRQELKLFQGGQRPKHVLPWLKRQPRKEGFKDGIFFKGKVKGKKLLLEFDSGSYRNLIPHTMNLPISSCKEVWVGDIGQQLTTQIAKFSEGVEIEIADWKTTIDCCVSERESVGRLNASFLANSPFVLNYAQCQIEIYEAEP